MSSRATWNGLPARAGRAQHSRAPRGPLCATGRMLNATTIVKHRAEGVRTARPCCRRPPAPVQVHREPSAAGRLAGGCFWNCAVNQKLEPDARLAADPHLAVHPLDQSARDGQAQAGAAVLAGGRAVRLRKRLEHPRLRLLGPDRCPCPRPRKSSCTVRRRDTFRADIERDLALFRKFHGVGKQVEQHLAQASGVAAQVGRHPGL